MPSGYVPQWVEQAIENLDTRTTTLEQVVVRLLETQSEPLTEYDGPTLRTTRSKGIITMSTVRDTDTPGVLALTLDDAANFPAVADGGTVPAWSVDNTSVVTVTPAADGMTAVPAWVGQGVANVTVSLTDADGTVVNIPTYQFTVVAGEATQGTITYTPGTAAAAPTGTVPPADPTAS